MDTTDGTRSYHSSSDSYELLGHQIWALQLEVHDLTARVQRTEELLSQSRQDCRQLGTRVRWLEHFLAALRSAFRRFLETPQPPDLEA